VDACNNTVTAALAVSTADLMFMQAVNDPQSTVFCGLGRETESRITCPSADAERR